MITPHDKALAAALAAFNQTVNEPQMIKCDRCDGKGYHHGFGENGVDPDWCDKCGGGGYDMAPGEEIRALSAAISAYLSSIGGIVVPVDPDVGMIRAWYRYKIGFHFPGDKPPVDTSDVGAYRAMMAASPLHIPIEAVNGGDEEEPWWKDKIEGLEADLDSAIEVAWKRGATDWVRLNYPTHYARLSSVSISSNEGREKP